jgi:hypothetical protein
MTIDGSFGDPFKEQIDFFIRKLSLPTAAWDDIFRAAHDRFFMVAGAMKADLVNDLQQAVGRAIREGEGLEAFRDRFYAAVDKNGWHGWTGEDSQAGRDWRTRVIYQTNLQTSWAAGRYKQLMDPDLLAVRPYWLYIHNDSVAHPRPLHKEWGDEQLTLRYDDPFWDTHYPPNGWGCRCRVKAVREPADGAATARPDGWDSVDAKTGEPPGIDKGWGYAPGANTETPLRSFVQEKLITYEPAIAKALTRDINRYIATTRDVAGWAREVLADTARAEPLWVGFVENPERLAAAAGGRDMTGYLVTIPADAVRHVENSHGLDGGSQRPPRAADFQLVQTVLNFADQILAGDKTGTGSDAIIALKRIGTEVFRIVFEIRPGAKNRALALKSFVVKT